MNLEPAVSQVTYPKIWGDLLFWSVLFVLGMIFILYPEAVTPRWRSNLFSRLLGVLSVLVVLAMVVLKLVT